MQDVFIPVVGMAPDDVVLTDWLMSPGDTVRDGDVVAVVETSKAEMEIAVSADGVLGAHLFDAGETITPGATITTVREPGDAPEAPVAAPNNAAPQTFSTDNDLPTPAVPAVPADTRAAAPAREHRPATLVDGADGPPDGPGFAVDPPVPGPPPVDGVTTDRPRHLTSPRQRRVAAEAALAAQAPPTPTPTPAPAPPPAAGPDLVNPPTLAPRVDAAADAATDAGPAADPPPAEDRFRQAISAAVTRSWREIPHFSVSRELTVDGLTDAVTQWRVVLPDLTMTDLLLRAWGLALLDRHRRTDLHLGLAVATDRGVVIPVIGSVLHLGMVELVDARRAAVARARAGRLHPDDATVPVSTLSNLGAACVDRFTGVIPYGQTDILTVGRAADRVVAVDRTPTVATTMDVTLNADHRSWDGWDAGQALARFAGVLSSPALLSAPAPAGVAVPAQENS